MDESEVFTWRIASSFVVGGFVEDREHFRDKDENEILDSGRVLGFRK